MSFDQEDAVFRVVVNEEEQYSLWPEWKAIPAGWREAGFSGKKQACLEHIETVWTDMRSLSLRRRMEAAAGNEGHSSSENERKLAIVGKQLCRAGAIKHWF